MASGFESGVRAGLLCGSIMGSLPFAGVEADTQAGPQDTGARPLCDLSPLVACFAEGISCVLSLPLPDPGAVSRPQTPQASPGGQRTRRCSRSSSTSRAEPTWP